jgi:hypothetical protein
MRYGTTARRTTPTGANPLNQSIHVTVTWAVEAITLTTSALGASAVTNMLAVINVEAAAV